MVIDLTEREEADEFVAKLVEMLTGPGYYTPAAARAELNRLRATAMREAAAMADKLAASEYVVDRLRSRAKVIEEGKG
jgi:hypothetical protein